MASGTPLGVILDEAPEWTSIYFDDVAKIFALCTDDCRLLDHPTADKK